MLDSDQIRGDKTILSPKHSQTLSARACQPARELPGPTDDEGVKGALQGRKQLKETKGMIFINVYCRGAQGGFYSRVVLHRG